MTELLVTPSQSFIVQLRSVTPGAAGDVGVTDTTYRGGVAQDGWLVLRENLDGSRPCWLFFDVQRGPDGQVLYAVHPASSHDQAQNRQNGRLEISRNGYLGFYKQSTSGQCWTLAFNEALGDAWHRVELLTAQGAGVKAASEYGGLYSQCLQQTPQERCVPLPESYLNAQQGQPLQLAARLTYVYR